MKKTITKFKLEELAKEMPVLSEIAKRDIVGGTAYTVDQNGNFTEISGSLNDHYIKWANNGVTGIIQIGSDVSIDTVNDMRDDSVPSGVSSGVKIEGATFGVFKQLAEHTNVEWACSCNTMEDDDLCLINTNHGTDHVSPLCKSGYSTMVHNHVLVDTSDSENEIIESEADDTSKETILSQQKHNTLNTNYKDFYIYGENIHRVEKYRN